VKARELIEAYDAIKGSDPRRSSLDVSKLAAAFVFQGKKAPDPHRVGLNSMAVKYANEHDVDLVMALRAVGQRWSEIFIDPTAELRHMSSTPSAESPAPADNPQSQLMLRWLAEQGISSQQELTQLLGGRVAKPAPAPAASSAPNDARPSRAVQAIEDRRVLEVSDQDTVVDEWAEREGAERGVDGAQAKLDHAMARVKAANAQNKRGGR
jgi:hypothetical protein